MLNQAQMEQLWVKLNIHYGEAWNRKWGVLDQSMVMNEWREYLGSGTPGQIMFALKNLPEHPPNATQFKEVCWKAPATQIEPPQRIAISPPQDLGDGPEAMQRRQEAYKRFKQAMKEMWK